MADSQEPKSPNPSAPPPNTETPPTASRDRRWFVLLPALTFIVGLLLGGLLVWVSDLGEAGDDEDGATAEPTVEPTGSPTETSPGAEPDRTITIPGPCVEAAELSQEVLDLMDDVAAAARALDAAELQSLVDRMSDLEPQVRDRLEVCQELGLGTTGP